MADETTPSLSSSVQSKTCDEEKEQEEESTTSDDDEAQENDVSRRPPCCNTNPMRFLDAARLEVTLRVTLASLFSYCLATANVPNAIPPRTGYLVGLVGPILAMAMPTLLFGIGAVVPGFVFALFYGLASATMLLAVSTAGNGALVGVFAVWSLWMSSLYFGPNTKSTTFTGSFTIAVTVLICCSFFQFAQHGVIVEAPWDYLVEYCASTTARKEGDTYVGILCQVLTSLGGQLPEDGVQVELTTGIFAGHTVTIEPTSSSSSNDEDDDSMVVTMSIAGGLWVVRSLWTWTGLTNPLAAIQNFIIVWAWGILCALVSPLLPPFRTVRCIITQTILPGALQGASAALMAATKEEAVEQNSSSSNHGGSIDDMGADKPRLHHLIHAAHLLTGPKLASMTAYEPRLWRPRECTWPILLRLNRQVKQVVVAALAVDAVPHRMAMQCDFHSSIELLTRCVDILKTSGSASSQSIVLLHHDEPAVCAEPEDGNGGQEYISLRMYQIAHGAAVAADAWIAALNGSGDPPPPMCSRAAWNNVVTNLLPWIYPILVFAKRLIETITLLFCVQSWRSVFCAPFPGVTKVAWCVKHAGGLTALFAMTVFWSNYRNFEIPTANRDPVTLDEIAVSNPPPQDYSGWHLMAYIFATTPTLEGSIKKGFLRLVGTIFGAFSAWLAILATGENGYGLVAWLTLTTIGAAYFSYEDGLLARLGLSENHGYGGFYFVSTQSIVALEVFAAQEDLNKYVVNRIVANTTGILMAVVVSLVPPRIQGGNPVWAEALLAREKRALADCLSLVLIGDAAGLEEQRERFLDEALSLHSEAVNRYKDASRLPRFPFWRTDPALLSALEALTVTGSLINSLFMHASHIANDEDLLATFADGTRLHKEVKLALQEIKQAMSEEHKDGSEADSGTEQGEENSESHARTQPEAFVLLVTICMKQMQDHASVLSNVTWGFFSREGQQ